MADEQRGSESALRIEGITKRFGPLIANDHISLTLARGEVLALLGENGAGKTTLMNILFGHYVADEGAVYVRGAALRPGSPHAAISAGIGMVHQHFTLADNLTVLDNVVLGTESLWRVSSKRHQARRRLMALAKQFGFRVDSNARVADLSVGERQHVEILKVLYRDAHVLIMDEPTAVLVPHEVEALFATLRKLAGHGVSVIFISHKLREVVAIADRIVVLRRGCVVAERATSAVNAAELAELMVGQPIPQLLSGGVLEKFAPGEPVLRLCGVTLAVANGHALLDNVNLTVRRHEIVGVAGVSGNGQSTLADLLSGLVQPNAGTIEILGELVERLSPIAIIDRNVARIPEDRHATGLFGDMTIWENIIAERYRNADFARAGFQRVGCAKAYSTKIIADFDVRCPGPDAVTRLLSGGNLQKLILGRTLSRSPEIIIANQPTRGLDVGAASYVHRRLISARARGAGVLLISDDLDELLDLSDRVVVMYRGKLLEPMSRDQIDIRNLSLQMAGQASHAH
jgi:ABC-type uncharacterized transport system ATPase subunit